MTAVRKTVEVGGKKWLVVDPLSVPVGSELFYLGENLVREGIAGISKDGHLYVVEFEQGPPPSEARVAYFRYVRPDRV